MILSESLLWALGEDGMCGINIYCAPENKETVEHMALLFFNEEWEAAKDSCEEEYGECVEKDNDSDLIASASEKEYGVQILIEPPYLSYNDGDEVDTNLGYEAVVKALRRVKKQFSDIKFDGYIGYCYSTVSSGEVAQNEIAEDGTFSVFNVPEKTYDFVKNVLETSLRDEEFWEELSEKLEDEDEDTYIEIITNLRDYGLDEYIERVLDIAEEYDDSIREILDDEIESWS